jgi:hypothetical protein
MPFSALADERSLGQDQEHDQGGDQPAHGNQPHNGGHEHPLAELECHSGERDGAAKPDEGEQDDSGLAVHHRAFIPALPRRPSEDARSRLRDAGGDAH